MTHTAAAPICLEARGLGVERGLINLVQDLSFTAPGATLLHLRGPNGSGKTTLLRCLAGLTPAAAGELLWCGRHCSGQAEFIAALNYVGHSPGLSAELSARENLTFIARLRAARVRGSITAALTALQANRFGEQPVKQLSAGQRQRVALARLALFDCALWMLDEPFTALDAPSRALLESLIDRHLDDGGIVIIATHQAFTSRHARHDIELDRIAA